MKLRDYQALASETLSRTKRGIVVVPAGGGKTVIAAASIIRAINARHAVGNEAKPVIRWIAATRDQCGQAWAALEAFELCNVATIEVGCPGKAWEHSNPDLAVIDECHHVPRRFLGSCPFRLPQGPLGIHCNSIPQRRENG